MEKEWVDILLLYVRHMAATVLIIGAILLLARSRDNRARRMLAMNMMLYGVIFLYALLAGVFAGSLPFSYPAFNMMDPMLQFVRNIYIVIFFLFPIEVILPGWLTFSRFLRLLLPDVVLALAYCIGVGVEGRGVEAITTYEVFLDHFSHFNVWFRMMFMLLAVIYIYSLLKLISDHEHRYQQWCRDNYSNDDNREISWMKLFVLAILTSTFFYFILSFSGSEIALLVHNVIVTFLYGALLYKGLFYENPYPEGFFRKSADALATLNERESGPESGSEKDPDFMVTGSVQHENMARFEEWMKKEKPYLYKDFKLMDVSMILHLKRTALSRLFNEGYGCSFHDIVRSYRLEDAKHLLVGNPSLPVHKVAGYCGFSSSSAFIRSFVEAEGITPNRYRKQQLQ